MRTWLRRDDAIRRVIDGDWPPIWTTEYRFVSDDPFKASAKPGLERSSVLGMLEPVMRGSQSSLSVTSFQARRELLGSRK